MDWYVKRSRPAYNAYLTSLQNVHSGTTRKKRQRARGPGNPRKKSRYQNQPSSLTSRPFANSSSTRSEPVNFLVHDPTEAYLNRRIIYNALSEMNYDANKLPLGSFRPPPCIGRFPDIITQGSSPNQQSCLGSPP